MRESLINKLRCLNVRRILTFDRKILALSLFAAGFILAVTLSLAFAASAVQFSHNFDIMESEYGNR